MKNLMSRSILLIVLMLVCVGCEDFLTGLGTGAAGQETLQSWKENLETKQAELKARYDAVLAEIESAPDPNVLALATKKLQPIQMAMVGNEAALMTVNACLDYPKDNPDKRNDFFASLVIGVSVLTYEYLSKRKLNTKYVSMKEGQALFESDNSEAGKKLYAAIGLARRKRGL